MANETVLFKRGDSATITSTPVTDGQILFDTSGNGKMYLDNGTDRLEMGGAITVDASLSKTSTNAIQNKAVTGNILNSLAEVSAATQQNTIAGALALKEVNSSLGGLKFGKDGEGNYGYFGDDDVLIPFSGDATINSVNQASYTIEEDGKYIVTAIGNASYKPIIYVNNVQQTPISETTQSGFSTYVSIYELELKKSDVLTTHWYLLHVIKC